MAKLLIFDWDGTLCDSLSQIASCVRSSAEDQGLAPPSFSDIREIVGLGLTESFCRLFPGLTKGQIILMCSAYSRHFVEADRTPAPFFEGALGVLEDLKSKGYFLAVATGKSRTGLNRTLKARGMINFFHGSRCADETAGKPNPLMLNQLLSEFNVLPGDAIMVGDTEYDLAMAVSAGVSSIGVSYGAHCPSRFDKYHPLGCIDKLIEINYYINQ